MLQTGANLAIDWATRKFFPKATSFLFKLPRAGIVEKLRISLS